MFNGLVGYEISEKRKIAICLLVGIGTPLWLAAEYSAQFIAETI